MAAVWRSQCAFARIFGGKSPKFLNNSTDLCTKQFTQSLSVLSSRNYSRYGTSPFVTRIQEQYEFEIVKKPSEWAYVERLLPFETIPKITPKDQYPSGWIPPKDEAKNLPYFIARTKNFEVPIYLQTTHKGQRRISIIKKIEGDIWMINDEIKELLKKKYKKYVETRVHELGRFIEVKGDYVNDLMKWAHSKGF